jgi:putative MATE family efflux protein
VGLVATTVNSITGVLGVTSIAFNILGAKLKGQGNHSEMKNHFMTNFLIDVFFGIAFFLGALLGGKFILTCFYGLKGEVLDLSVDYLNIFSISLGINMILFTFSSYFKIVGRTKYIFYANITSSILNVVFDYMLIFGNFGFPKLGVRGNAIGSVLALCLGVIVYLIAAGKDTHIKMADFKPLRVLKDIIRVSVPIMGQEVLESTVFVLIINSILARIGIIEVSVYTLLLAIVNIALMPMYSYSQTSLTLISENIGAGDKGNVIMIPRVCLCLAVMFYGVISLFILILNKDMARIITNERELIYASMSYLPAAIFSGAFNIPSTIYKYSLQGIGDEKSVFVMSVFINFLGVGLILILGLALRWKLNGVYMGMLLNYLILFLLSIQGTNQGHRES